MSQTTESIHTSFASDQPDGTSGTTRRFSTSIKEVEGRSVIDVHNYVPYFFAAINNALSRGASQKYIDEFGIGIVEWRIVSMLAIEPRITATRICEVVLLDKSATSRGLRSLQEKGFLNFLEAELDARRRIWWLNQEGYALHDRVLEVALDRECKLLQNVDPADLEIALRVMRQMRENIHDLSN